MCEKNLAFELWFLYTNQNAGIFNLQNLLNKSRYEVEFLCGYTAWKVSKYGVFSGPYFPIFGLNTTIHAVVRHPESNFAQSFQFGVCVCVCVCVCLRPFTVKASLVWISWDTREQINDVMLKKLISYVKSFHRYFLMHHLTLTFLTSHFILFA